MTESVCLRHTEIPHTSELFSDFQYHFDRVAKFYAGPPGDARSYASAAKQIQFPGERRSELVAALRSRNGENASLSLLARPETVAVVTGQQVGLFGGPAYTIYKALTAVQLAAQLTAQGIPAVPLFWLPTEDHDFAEVNHTYVFGPDHRPILLSVDGPGGGDQPVGSIPVVSPPLDRLQEALSAFPFAEETLAMVREAYQPGVTLGAAFQALLQRLLAKYGLLFIDPLDPAVRRMAAPILREAVRQDEQLHRKLLERIRELETAGYHAQVHIEPKTSLFFLLEGGRRIALRRQNGDYLSKERRYSAQELMDRAENLSPNALLRPVIQDYVLPTVAYAGGPAELAYMAQSQVLYGDLLGRMPVTLARSAFTLLDARTSKLMKRFDLPLPAFFQGEDQVRQAIGQNLIPTSLSHEFNQIRESTAGALQRLRDHLAALDETLASATDKSRAKILYQLSKIENKTAREIVNRNQRADEDASYMSDLIYPEKHLQERFYSILPFLAKHGPGLIDTLYERIHLDCPDHKVLVV
jgi:bacillithiol biosynthesis cysteine-adding enzyme BshC